MTTAPAAPVATADVAPPPAPHAAPARSRLAAAAFAAAMLCIATLGVALRWVDLGRESLWFDEGMTAYLAQLTPDVMVRTIAGDVAAPLLFFLMRYWTGWLGEHEAALRSLSAAAATLAVVPFAFLLARSVTSRAAALAGAVLFAASLAQVEYAREARYYALLTLLVCGALAGAVSFVERRSEIGIAAVVGCATLGLYTHNMAAFYLPGLAAAWLLWPGPRAWWKRAVDGLVAAAIVFLLYLPWVPVVQAQMRWMAGTFWADRPTAGTVAMALSTLAGVHTYDIPRWASDRIGRPWPVVPTAAVVAAVLLGLVGLALATRDRPRLRKAAALAAFALLPVALAYAWSLWRQPVFVERAFAPSTLVLPVLLAMAVDVGRRRGLRVVAAAGVAVLAVVGIVSTVGSVTGGRKLVPGEDWRGAHAYVAALERSPRRLVVFVANEGELPFMYYAERADPTPPVEGANPRTGEPVTLRPATFGPMTHRDVRRTGVPAGFFDLEPPKTIRRVTGNDDLGPLVTATANRTHNEVVLVLSHDAFADPDGLSEAYLRKNWRLVEERTFNLVRVLRFARK